MGQKRLPIATVAAWWVADCFQDAKIAPFGNAQARGGLKAAHIARNMPAKSLRRSSVPIQLPRYVWTRLDKVILDAFWIDKTEVTNAQFCRFLNAKGNQSEEGIYWFEPGAGHRGVVYGYIDKVDGVFIPRAGYETYWEKTHLFLTVMRRGLRLEVTQMAQVGVAFWIWLEMFASGWAIGGHQPIMQYLLPKIPRDLIREP